MENAKMTVQQKQASKLTGPLQSDRVESEQQLTANDIDQENNKNYKWNFAVNTLDSGFHGLSTSLVSATTILPLYVSYLTKNSLLVGLVAAIAGSAYLFPQLFVANFIEGLSRKKPIVVQIGFFLERLPFLVIAISSFLFARTQPILALITFFLMYAWFGLGEGVVSIAWREMLAKLFSPEKRGRFFGVSSFVEALLGVLGSIVAALILGAFAYPDNFTVLFALAFGGLCIAWLFLTLIREPAKAPTRAPVSQVAYFSNLPSLIIKDRNFRNFILSRVVTTLGRMGIGFVAVYAVSRWSVSAEVVGQFTITLLASQMISFLLLGFLADKYGHKLSIIFGLGTVVLAMLVSVLVSAPLWMYFVFALIGVNAAAEALSANVIIYEFASEEKRPTYIGLSSTIIGIFAIISPLIGGEIANLWGYTLLFSLASILLTLALVLTVVVVREPRRHKHPANGISSQESAG